MSTHPTPAAAQPAPPSWHVYLIECQDGSIYTGISNDVAARYAAHLAGKGARYTRARPPRRLLLSLDCGDRAAASRLEYRVKQLPAARKRTLAPADLAALLASSAGDEAKKP